MFKEKVSLAVILTTIILGGLLYVNQKYFPREEKIDETACPADAMICPDGSYVGRKAPDCEFEECPLLVEPIDIEEETPSAEEPSNSENDLKIE